MMSALPPILQRLRNAELCAVVPSSHRFSQRQAVSVSELTEEPLVRVPPEVYPHLDACLMECSEVEGRRPRILHADPNTFRLVSSAESGLAVTVLSTLLESVVRNCDVVFPPVANASFDAGVELWRHRSDHSPIVEELLLDAQTGTLVRPEADQQARLLVANELVGVIDQLSHQGVR